MVGWHEAQDLVGLTNILCLGAGAAQYVEAPHPHPSSTVQLILHPQYETGGYLRKFEDPTGGDLHYIFAH